MPARTICVSISDEDLALADEHVEWRKSNYGDSRISRSGLIALALREYVRKEKKEWEENYP